MPMGEAPDNAKIAFQCVNQLNRLFWKRHESYFFAKLNQKQFSIFRISICIVFYMIERGMLYIIAGIRFLAILKITIYFKFVKTRTINLIAFNNY